MMLSAALRRTFLLTLSPLLLLLPARTCPAAVSPSLSLFEPLLVSATEQPDAFPLVADQHAAPLLVDATDHKGVLRAVTDLREDIRRVTGILPELSAEGANNRSPVLIGTLGMSPRIDALIAAGKLDGSQLSGKWESFVIATVSDPMPGVPRALVIAGSDKRGTIYGIYELSRQIGVSPWYWWADVPAAHRSELLLRPGAHASGEPSVRYRGIFINDEAPALRRWAQEKFGGLTPEFYRHVFELLLRCRANFLWPAMWLPTSFNDDFPENPRLADEYGIVMSTSHHEPMMRAHHEWMRYGKGPWNYETNGAVLREFWRGGFERVKGFENVVTVGMRGDGDEAMSESTAVPLLKGIIADQRRILSEVSGKPASQVPQLWALYKEVQDYYDKGMRVDDDILVLFSDDNWGNLRFLPKPEDRTRSGGFGMYYHVDYVGAPVSYRWLNVSQIERVWEQMRLSYAAGVRGLWILNVGDIKPMELPMSFFLDLAWKPEAIQAGDLRTYYVQWASQQFGPAQAPEIADLLALYTKYNARRTPEMLEGGTYSVANYREADRVVAEYQALVRRAQAVDASLPSSQKDAFFQLVLYPIEACATVTEMYVAAGKNTYYAERGAYSANYYADRVKELFERDAELTRRFHEQLSGGKWNHMMSQTHLGYTYWNHPPLNRMPAVSYVQPKDKAELGFLVEQGQRPRWGWIGVEAGWDFPSELPRFDRINDPSYQIDLINRGRTPLGYSLKPRQDWIRVSKSEGTLLYNEPIQVTIDWTKAPEGASTGEILLTGAGSEYTVKVPIRNRQPAATGFVEQDRVISIEAASFDRESKTRQAHWLVVPNLGRTGSAVIPAPFAPGQRLTLADAPCLEYDFTLLDDAKVTVLSYLSPTQDFRHGDGLHFAISIDDAPPQVVNLNEGEQAPDWKYPDWWNKSVADHIKIRSTEHPGLAAGKHTLKLWMLDAGVVVQKFVIDAGGLKPSYLGPPSSLHRP